MLPKMGLAFAATLLVVSTLPVKAASDPTGASCSEARLNYCKTKYDDNGYGPSWIKNHCSRAPYGTRFEYLTTAWRCLHD